MFAGAGGFNQPLEKWNVSNVGYMENMFNGAESFHQPLERWKTEYGIDLKYLKLGESFENDEK